MSHLLSFDHLFIYNSSDLGITLKISLQIDANLQTEEISAKVDTGSTYCVFQREYAEQLGISLEEGLPVSIGTSTNPFLAYGHEVNILLDKYSINTMVYFAADRIPRNILGRHGFLENFCIAIIDYESKLYLSEYNYFISQQPIAKKYLAKK
jgi:hypothetical protein